MIVVVGESAQTIGNFLKFNDINPRSRSIAIITPSFKGSGRLRGRRYHNESDIFIVMDDFNRVSVEDFMEIYMALVPCGFPFPEWCARKAMIHHLETEGKHND